MMRSLVGAMRSPGSLRGDAVRIYALQAATLALGIVTNVLVARQLGPSEKGVVDLFTLLNGFLLEFGVLGFNSGLLFYLANRGRALGEVHGTAVAFSLGAGAVTLVVGLAGGALWSSLLPGLPRWAILAAFVIAPATYYRQIWLNLMVGANRAVASYWLGLGTAVLTAAAVVALWLGGRLSAGTVIVITAAVLVLNVLWAFGMLARESGALRPDLQLGRDSLRFGIVLYVGLLANALHFKIDQLMLNRMLGTGAVGIYAVGVRWAETLFLLDSALIAAALHRISTAPAAESYRLTLRLVRSQALISGSAGLAVMVLAYPLVHILYGAEYGDAVVPLMLLVPGIVAWSMAKVLSQYIVYQRGDRWLPVIFAVVGVAANVLLNLWLIPRAALHGAGIASLLSYTLVLLLTAAAFRRLRPAAGEPDVSPALVPVLDQHGSSP